MEPINEIKPPRRARQEIAAPAGTSNFAAASGRASSNASSVSRAARAFSRFCRRNIFILVPFLILLAALSYYYYQYEHLLKQNSGAAAQVQVQQAIAAIEKLMYIPNDSNAQLATITDISKLSGQPFFQYAQNGDELVIFPNAQEAVIYRASDNKIINVGPFSSTSGTSAPATPASVPAPAKAPASSATSTKH